MMPLVPHTQRDAATASVRNCSVYSADFVCMLSELIEICEESGTERPAEESAEQFSQPAWQLAPCGENEYATGAHKSARDVAASFDTARCSDMSAWSCESNSSFFSTGSDSSACTASSTDSTAAGQPRSFPGFWRRKQERRRLTTIICEGATPDKNMRVAGGIYLIAGERKKWDGRQWRRVCCAGNCCAASRGTGKYCTVHRGHSQ
jgi:hypothetical protein